MKQIRGRGQKMNLTSLTTNLTGVNTV